MNSTITQRARWHFYAVGYTVLRIGAFFASVVGWEGLFLALVGLVVYAWMVR